MIVVATMANLVRAANPYWIALIAVLGTAFGAGISAITQMLTTRRSSASQLAILKLQLEHQTDEARRQERREVYTKFLLAHNHWELLCIRTYDALHDKEDPPSVGEAQMEYAAALAHLDLFAGKKLCRLANELFNQDQRLFGNAQTMRNNPSTYRPNGDMSPVVIVAAMQNELQITGAAPINPQTGLRVWGDIGSESPPSSR